MRASGALMIAVLMAAGYALYLSSRDAASSFDAVTGAAEGLREEGIAGQPFDRDSAASMVSAMESLAADPETINEHLADLRTFTETAAAWAASSPAASSDLHVAVSLRAAAGELRAHALSPSAAHLSRARRKLESARASLDGSDTTAGSATDGLRDRLENLQQSAEEQRQELDEALRR